MNYSVSCTVGDVIRDVNGGPIWSANRECITDENLRYDHTEIAISFAFTASSVVEIGDPVHDSQHLPRAILTKSS